MKKTRSSKSAAGKDQGIQGAKGGVDNDVEAASSGTEFVSLTGVREMLKVPITPKIFFRPIKSSY